MTLQTGSALGAHGMNTVLKLEFMEPVFLQRIVATEFHIGFCTVAAAAPPIFFKGKFLT